MAEEIINRVANSSLITLDLEEMYPEGERVLYDLKDNLWQGLALKEKDFRAFIKEHDWSQYKGKNVALYCSVDAIIPSWAYLLLSTAINPYANFVTQGNLETLEVALWENEIAKIDPKDYEDAKLVIKGCSDKEVPASAYLALGRKLQPVVKTMMFGEACSTVPLYKKPRNSA